MRTPSAKKNPVMRLLLANNKPVERIGMQKLLARYFESDTIQEEVGTKNIIEWVKHRKYDLIIVDSSYSTIQKGNILIMIKEMRNMRNTTPVLVTGNHEDKQYALNSYMAGSTGYVDKSSSVDEFMRAVDTALSGKKYVAPMLNEYLADQVAGGHIRKTEKPLHETLSCREFQVMLSMAQGLTQTEIARNLNVHRKTVYTYKTRVFEKMHMETITQLVTYALLHGLINVDMKPDDYHA